MHYILTVQCIYVFSVVCTIMTNFDFGCKEPSGSASKELFN